MKDFIVCGPIIFCFVPVAFVQEEMCCGNSFFQKEAGWGNMFQKDRIKVLIHHYCLRRGIRNSFWFHPSQIKVSAKALKKILQIIFELRYSPKILLLSLVD